MIINNTLQQAILSQVDGMDVSKLERDAQNISLRYRTNHRQNTNLIMNDDEALAYAVTRMPATYGAVLGALGQLSLSLAQPPRSLLDVGAGTGAATWAAAEQFELTDILCLEREESMMRIGKRIMSYAQEAFQCAAWVKGDATAGELPYKADLVIASYMLNEMSLDMQRRVAEKLWNATNEVLLIIEPGTPVGFSALKQIRNQLLLQGAHIAGPCPHEGLCPMPEDDWCHFSRRIPRSRLHRQLKGGDVPYEDEKFSYMAFVRTAGACESMRVLRHPQIYKGHVVLDVCSAHGLKNITLTKKDGEAYKRARKASAGDGLYLE